MEFVDLIILAGSFFILLALGIPIAICIGISTAITMLVSIPAGPALTTVAQQMATGLDSFALLAIPFFILAGQLMNRGGIANRLIDFAKSLVGMFPGGLAYVNIVAAMLFGAISGSAVAAASAIGGIMTPRMAAEGYNRAFGAAVNITSSTTGLIIPPSNILIVYSLASGGASIGALFVAGYIPGIIVGLGLMLVAGVFAWRNNYPVGESFKIRPLMRELGYAAPLILLAVLSLMIGWPSISVFLVLGTLYSLVLTVVAKQSALPSLFMLVVVIGGIIAGIFTATEAAAVAVAYAFVLSLIYREMKVLDLPGILLDTVVTTGIVMLLIATSIGMSWVLAYANIPQNVSEGLIALTESKIMILLIINLILLVVGMFMDMTPAVLIFTPIFLPVVVNLGVDPIHFGIMMVLNLCVGICTPPVGSVLFVGCGVANVSITQVVRPLLPLFAAMVIALLLVTYIPALSLWLPGVFGL